MAESVERRKRNRQKRLIEQLIVSTTQKYEKAKAEEERLQVKRRELAEVEAKAMQALIAIESGENAATNSERIRRRSYRRDRISSTRPHLTEEELNMIHELKGSLTQKEIADKIGTSQATVSYHINEKEKRRSVPQGAPLKITPAMEYALCRFSFLLRKVALKDCSAFLKLAFKLEVSKRTIERHNKKCGFRIADFMEFHPDRNRTETLDSRKAYAQIVPSNYGPNALFEAVYMDEMGLTFEPSRKAWSLCHWVPDVVDSFESCSAASHLTLLVAVSPALGLVNYEIVRGPVDSEGVLSFIENTFANLNTLTGNDRSVKRLLILDDAGPHKKATISSFFENEPVSSTLRPTYLPPHSPFLNPCEEIFGLIATNLWREEIQTLLKGHNIDTMTKTLADQCANLSKELIVTCYEHMTSFLKACSAGQMIFTRDVYEAYAEGDEYQKMADSEEVDMLLNSYLPQFYEEFTPDNNSTLEDKFGVPRLTKDCLESFK
uniref:Tc1-like transposase DDE domain-containing protein n=1 Tax=Rhodosorus marinus TaxID=101924 RepID=A0A7S3E830_9RHOD|mmetsp:Transcript_16262/g.67276  ORF Transcript_16262/g.67276 Transcript_16262/m.67276 type:complete len:492 (+) Transcript_16262:510-1985(+)